MRKISKESATGSVTTEKKHLKLTLAVEEILWDGDDCTLRVKGKTTEQHQDVRVGSYHTIELTKDMSFQLHKEAWDEIHRDRINQACDPMKSAHVAAVVMHEGLATICYLSTHMTITKAVIEKSIPKKRPSGLSGHNKAVDSFYTNVAKGVKEHIDLDSLKCVIVAGPNFTTEVFMKKLMELAVQNDWRDILTQKNKFVCVHASSGHV